MIDKQVVINKLKENKKIPVLELVNGYNKCASDSLKERYLNEKIIIKDYIPYVEKMTIGKSIIKYSCFDENNNLYIDSCKKYIMTVYQLLTIYTNIDQNATDLQIGYDALCSAGMLEPLMALIPKHEFKEINTVIKMSFDDIMTNSYEGHAFIVNTLNKYIPVFKELLSPLIDVAVEQIKNYKI